MLKYVSLKVRTFKAPRGPMVINPFEYPDYAMVISE